MKQFHSFGKTPHPPGFVKLSAPSAWEGNDIQQVWLGGRLRVSPKFDDAVLGTPVKAGMATMPSVLTPTEALAAVKAGNR